MTCSEIAPLLEELQIRDLNAYFQPIVHLHSARIVGFEALLRPATYDGAMLAPGFLFEQAALSGCLPDLEREARVVALRDFSASSAEDQQGQMLFLNVSAPLLNRGDLDARHIRETVQDFRIDPRSVAVEISESAVQETELLLAFSRAVRQSGFILALDGYGTDQSHLERIARIRPEIIKIDRSIVQGVCKDEIKQYVMESVVHLARRVGAVSLAFGIEDYEDLLTCARMGVELGQGFLLGRPAPSLSRALTRGDKTFPVLHERLTASLAGEHERLLLGENALRERIDTVLAELVTAQPDQYGPLLERWTRSCAEIDSSFITTTEGEQVTETAVDETRVARRIPLTIQAANVRDNHRSREYIYGLRLREHDALYLSSPHLSPATGELCRTCSRKFAGQDGTTRILCVTVTLSTLQGTPA